MKIERGFRAPVVLEELVLQGILFRNHKMKMYRRVRMHLLCFALLTIIFFRIASIFSSDYFRQKDCEPLPQELYKLLQSQIDLAYHHGYRKVSRCGQSLYLDDIKYEKQEYFSPSAEKYAETIKNSTGTGSIDFQYPDTFSKTVNHGYVLFPSDLTCQRDKTRVSY